MAKELPYFKFYTSDWLTGDITLETDELQGVFINICAYYWSKDCELSLVNLNKKFRGKEDKIKDLIKSEIIKIKAGEVKINFLIEQLKSKELTGITNRINGLKGGRPKKIKTEKKANGFILETESITQMKANDNPNITNIKESKVNKITYSVFWDLYDKKVGDKNKCEKKWVKLSLEVQKKIIETLPVFLKQFTDKQFQPYPETYLNKERWNDELKIEQKKETPLIYRNTYMDCP